jgi:hypothetical protein
MSQAFTDGRCFCSCAHGYGEDFGEDCRDGYCGYCNTDFGEDDDAPV